METVRWLGAVRRECFIHITTELAFREAIGYAHFLFLEHLLAIFALAAAPSALVFGTTLCRHRKFLCLRFFEYSGAEALSCLISRGSFHKYKERLHATRLGRARSVVWDWCRICNRADLNTFTGERAQHRFASSTDTSDDHGCLLEANHHTLLSEELANLC